MGKFFGILKMSLSNQAVITILTIITVLLAVPGCIVALPEARSIVSSFFTKRQVTPVPYLTPTPTPLVMIAPTPTQASKVTPTPTQAPTVIPTAVPTATVAPSPSPIPNATPRETMQLFCDRVYTGDEHGAFSLLTTEAQQKNYQGNIQEFWSDFGEYSGSINGCKVDSCTITSCNVTLSSPMHRLCQDNFTFVNEGNATPSWYITDWTPLNNGCS